MPKRNAHSQLNRIDLRNVMGDPDAADDARSLVVGRDSPAVFFAEAVKSIRIPASPVEGRVLDKSV
jgi:hypothetical protein